MEQPGERHDPQRSWRVVHELHRPCPVMLLIAEFVHRPRLPLRWHSEHRDGLLRSKVRDLSMTDTGNVMIRASKTNRSLPLVWRPRSHRHFPVPVLLGRRAYPTHGLAVRLHNSRAVLVPSDESHERSVVEIPQRPPASLPDGHAGRPIDHLIAEQHTDLRLELPGRQKRRTDRRPRHRHQYADRARRCAGAGNTRALCMSTPVVSETTGAWRRYGVGGVGWPCRMGTTTGTSRRRRA